MVANFANRSGLLVSGNSSGGGVDSGNHETNRERWERLRSLFAAADQPVKTRSSD